MSDLDPEVEGCWSNVSIMWTPIFEWHVIRCGCKDGHPKNHVFKRDWTTWSKLVNHSMLYSQHNWGGDYTINQWTWESSLWLWIRYSYEHKNYEENGYGHVWICKSYNTNCVFHILFKKWVQRETCPNKAHSCWCKPNPCWYYGLFMSHCPLTLHQLWYIVSRTILANILN